MNGSACRLVKMLSLPNIVMNHGSSRSRKAVASRDRRRESQSGEIDQAAAVGRFERLRVALDARSLFDPPLEVALHRKPSRPRSSGLRCRLADTELERDNVELGLPLAVRLDLDLERQAALVDSGGLARRDSRRATKHLPLVPENELPSTNPSGVRPLLLERVLDLEEVGEVGAGLNPNGQVHWFVGVVQDRQVLVEAGAHGPLADHRELGVDVDGPRARHEEEARLEVLQIVDGERTQPLTIDR